MISALPPLTLSLTEFVNLVGAVAFGEGYADDDPHFRNRACRLAIDYLAERKVAAHCILPDGDQAPVSGLYWRSDDCSIDYDKGTVAVNECNILLPRTGELGPDIYDVDFPLPLRCVIKIEDLPDQLADYIHGFKSAGKQPRKDRWPGTPWIVPFSHKIDWCLVSWEIWRFILKHPLPWQRGEQANLTRLLQDFCEQELELPPGEPSKTALEKIIRIVRGYAEDDAHSSPQGE